MLLSRRAYGYDGNGNPTEYKGKSLTFDPENRMTAYGAAETNGYTADGLRAWTEGSAGVKTYFLYDGDSAIEELNSSGAVTATNTISDNCLISRHTSAESTFYDFDLSRNVAQRLTSTGSMASADVIDAFGTMQMTDTTHGPYAFSGQYGGYTDTATGLALCERRYYDPSTGRCVTRDPIGYDGGIDLYGYCGNDPVEGSDSSGFACIVQLKPGQLDYGHAYILFTLIHCNSGPQAPGSNGAPSSGSHVSVGFWAYPGVAGGLGCQPGVVLSPDPNAPDNKPHNGQCVLINNSLEFEIALYASISVSKRHPGRFCVPGRVCGSWTHEMWDCASLKVGGGSIHKSPHPRGPVSGGGSSS